MLNTTQIIFDIYKNSQSHQKFPRYLYDLSILNESQQGEAKGYNPQEHPSLRTFVDECRMVANFRIRSGNAYISNNFLSFLKHIMDRLKGEGILINILI